MHYSQGFTLIELMVSIVIIAILGGIGIPAYQGYVQKAALTDMLQTSAPYRMAVEVCSMEHSALLGCNAGSQGIPSGQPTRYVKAINIARGVISMTGQETLDGLSVVLTPTKSAAGNLVWTRACTGNHDELSKLCQSVFALKETSSDDE
ncbi:prepilin peptidase-dependent pilin [Yersinia nurmii]|uniref:Major pilin subunit n=1 Tax=Yersinia nurmii TaxID=685706 RepID=A0AAW7JYK6_9GAMM|nr:prepilin peptidase-dependent pilin [Yersinia nurmii]MDN0088133.1 prepilin peptidase-dependent pilin [Yersinia nurmii]CNE69728.1 putative major pilin subunit [Yersinia nurmii]